jgi:hypothetical protein
MLKYIVGSIEKAEIEAEKLGLSLDDFILNCHFNDKSKELKKVK